MEDGIRVLVRFVLTLGRLRRGTDGDRDPRRGSRATCPRMSVDITIRDKL